MVLCYNWKKKSGEGIDLKKWYDEEYEWEIEVIGFNKDNEQTERFCRNGEEIGDKYTCTYGYPVNAQGQGICSKVMMMLYPIMEAVRSGGDLENIGASCIIQIYCSRKKVEKKYLRVK